MKRQIEIKDGHLLLGGVPASELAKTYQTPLYVMEEDVIRENMRAYRTSMENYYEGRGLVCYASKAFSCKEIYRIAMEEGLGVDCVSLGELATAHSVGFPMEKVCLHGNNKSKEELKTALEWGVGRIVVDSLGELEQLNALAEELHKTASILLRIRPGIDAHTHSFIQTGQIDSKFGMALETGEAMEGVKRAEAFENIDLQGIHCHIGSQIFETEPFCHAAAVLMEFLAEVKKETGRELWVLNLGGGFGIGYTDEDEPKAFGAYMGPVAEVIGRTASEYGLNTPFVILEPGRSIVGGAGTTLYTVGAVREVPGIRTYVSVDGGMTDNPRFILYGAKYDMLLADRAEEEATELVTVAGRCCESGDLLGENIPLAPAKAGDLLAVFATGAYNYAMSSRYNRLPVPAIVSVKDGKAKLIVKRESLEDLLRNDL